MKRGFLFLAVCLPLFSLPSSSQDTTKIGAVSSDTVQRIVEQVKPSLVRIQVVTGEASGGRETKAESFGSGVMISESGYVVTNHHVAGNARWISCTLSDKRQVEAKLIGTDALSDIAVIKLDPAFAPYPAASWGDSSTLRVGDPVLAMGSPLALSQSVTSGIISNTELVMPSVYSGFILDGEDVGSIVRWIGHDAAIHPGNSGGPLVNLQGQIVGINEIELGLSGAIPAGLAREVADQLIATGRVLRAYTGIELQPRLRQDARTTGVLVSGVLAASPGAKAGVQAGDLILSVNNEPLDAKFPEQLPLVNLALTRLATDAASEFKIDRAGKEITIPIQPAPRELASSPSREVKGWGLTGSDITPFMAREYSFPGTAGVLVTGVITGGPSSEAEPALEELDIITKVGDKPVASLEQLRASSASIKASEDGTPTLVTIVRGGQQILTVVPVHKQTTEDTSVEVATTFFPASTQVLTPTLTKALKLPASTQGVRLTQLYPNSAAQLAGLQIGDIITKLDGMPIEVEATEDEDVFPAMIRQYKIGSTVELTVLRKSAGASWNKPQIKKMKLPQAPKGERELQTYRDEDFGITLRAITYLDRIRGAAAPGEAGVMVTSVEQGSWAALAGLQPGHVIRSIDGQPIQSMEAARSKLKAIIKARPKSVTIFVSTGIHTAFVEVQTDWSLSTPAGK